MHSGVEDLKGVELEKYRPMIQKKAYEAWIRLPPQTRSWVDLEDVVQEGLLYARYEVLKNWNPEIAKFSTFLWLSLENFFKNGTSHFFRVRRYEGMTMSLEDIGLFHPQAANSSMREIQAANCFLCVYFYASKQLRDQLVRWFLRPRPRFQDRGREFKQAQEEFKILSQRYGFNIEDARLLLTSDNWRVTLEQKFEQMI